MSLTKGILIVFEGIDGSGKTTQAKALLKCLLEKKCRAVYFREPSLSKWGREIKKKAAFEDSLSPEEEFDLFQKDRMENVRKNLNPALHQKKIVLMDRYYFSTVAYQGAKGIDIRMIRKANEKFAVKPDLVFILDIDPQRGLKRIDDRKKKDKLFEQEEYLVKVRKIFQTIKGKNIFQIDGRKPIEEIEKKIKKIALAYIEKYINCR